MPVRPPSLPSWRHVSWQHLAAFLVPGFAYAGTGAGDSLDQRLFLLRRSAESGECAQAVTASEAIRRDFGDVPGAHLATAYAMACTGNWKVPWAAVAEALAAGADLRAVEAMVRASGAFGSVRVIVDGAPSDRPEFAPATMLNGTLTRLRPLGGGSYTLDGMPPGTYRIQPATPSAEYAVASVDVGLTAGKTANAMIAWTSKAFGTLDISVASGGVTSTADNAALPMPLVTTADGTPVRLEAIGAGRWRAPRAPTGALRVVLPASAGNDEAVASVEVTRLKTSAVQLNVVRYDTVDLVRPAALDSSISLAVDGKELGTTSSRVRAGSVSVTAGWAGGSATPTTYLDDLSDGVDLPWVHVVADEREIVLHAQVHAPGDKAAGLDGVAVASDRYPRMTFMMEGALPATPGGISKGTVNLSQHPIVKRVTTAATARTSAIILAAGGGLGLIGGSTLAAIGYASGSAAAERARNATLEDGKAAYTSYVEQADAGAASANVGIGVASVGGAAIAGGLGWALLTGLPTSGSDVPLHVEPE